MAYRDFVKENVALLMGLTLPVILIVLFFLATVLPRSLASPPQYPLLLSTVVYGSPAPVPAQINFFVKDGALHARIQHNEGKNPVYFTRNLLVYDGAADNVHEISYDAASLAKLADGSDVVPEETRKMTIDTSFKSPDGYEFEAATYGHGGLVQELFGGNYRNRGPRLKKGAAAYKIPLLPYKGYYYGDVQFIGWIVKQ